MPHSARTRTQRRDPFRLRLFPYCERISRPRRSPCVSPDWYAMIDTLAAVESLPQVREFIGGERWRGRSVVSNGGIQSSFSAGRIQQKGGCRNSPPAARRSASPPGRQRTWPTSSSSVTACRLRFRYVLAAGPPLRCRRFFALRDIRPWVRLEDVPLHVDRRGAKSIKDCPGVGRVWNEPSMFDVCILFANEPHCRVPRAAATLSCNALDMP